MKKWLLRIGLGFFALLVLLYGFLMLRSILPATVNDGNLRLARASIPEGSNAFDVLQTASSHLWWPDDEERKIYDAAYAKLYSQARENGEAIPMGNPSIPKAVVDSMNRKTEHIQGYLLSTTNWDASLANTVLANNRETLAGWDAAAKLTDLQVPEIADVNTLTPYLSDWKRLATLAEVRENFLFHNGQDKEAFDRIMDQIQLGRRMQDSHSTLIGYLVGTAVNSMGLNQVQHWAGRAHLSPDQLKDYIRQLQLDPDEEGAAFANSMRTEYQNTIGNLDAMRKGKLTDPATGTVYPHAPRLLPVFNFSKTKALFASDFNLLVKAAPHHFNEAKLPDFGAHRPGPVSMVMSGNATGEVLYYMEMPAFGLSLSKKSQSDAQLQATRIILALRAYQLTHGNLPPDLNALVPEFLDAVPADDFDGQPLRYAPDRKIVYSVGQNLKDDGGNESRTGPSNNRPLDFVYKFDF